jgi:hypothetical protein
MERTPTLARDFETNQQLLLGQDYQDFLDISFLAFRLPTIARRSGEAGGDESQQIAVAFGE